MKHSGSIQFLKNHQIDKQQWDACVSRAYNRLIYASAFYLDNMCTGWEALTGDNYDWVMPVISNKKYGIIYLYQPSFMQQSGVFAKDESIIIPWHQIIYFLKKNYRFWEINLNYTTPVAVLCELNYKPAANFILNLSDSYINLFNNYKDVLRKNLKRSQHSNLAYKAADYLQGIEAYKKNYASRLKHVRNEDYEKFKRICSVSDVENKLICREVVDLNDKTLAIVLLLSDGRRFYNIMNTTMPEGKKLQANHFLIDAVIKEFSGKDIIFDFEGSDIPGVKTFYENFGAINEPYFMVKYNNLGWPLKLFK